MPTYQDVSVTPTAHATRSSAQKDSGPRAISPSSLPSGTPETVIGEYVVVKGELEFDRLLRIDGLFEGKLISEVLYCQFISIICRTHVLSVAFVS
jgi:hypothetical protein